MHEGAGIVPGDRPGPSAGEDVALLWVAFGATMEMTRAVRVTIGPGVTGGRRLAFEDVATGDVVALCGDSSPAAGNAIEVVRRGLFGA